jgi:hypothetical protein
MGELKKLRHTRKLDQSKTVEAEVSTCRGRDALATEVEKDPDPFFGSSLKKQSQFGAGQEELSAFKKREYELLLGATPPPNKANPTQRKTEIRGQRSEDRGQRTEKRRRREAFVCRY